jgi:hypothetical protein
MTGRGAHHLRIHYRAVAALQDAGLDLGEFTFSDLVMVGATRNNRYSRFLAWVKAGYFCCIGVRKPRGRQSGRPAHVYVVAQRVDPNDV